MGQRLALGCACSGCTQLGFAAKFRLRRIDIKSSHLYNPRSRRQPSHLLSAARGCLSHCWRQCTTYSIPTPSGLKSLVNEASQPGAQHIRQRSDFDERQSLRSVGLVATASWYKLPMSLHSRTTCAATSAVCQLCCFESRSTRCTRAWTSRARARCHTALAAHTW